MAVARGLGGPPVCPVHAGQTAYAVAAPDPRGATAGSAAGIDEPEVLPEGDPVPAAQTLDFPLGRGARAVRSRASAAAPSPRRWRP